MTSAQDVLGYLRGPALAVGLALTASGAAAGPSAYDVNLLLNDPHPFKSAGTDGQYAAEPVAESQIRAPARMPPPSAGAMPARTAAAPSVGEIRPPVASLAEVAPAQGEERRSSSGILSEFRIGVLAHDTGPFSRNEEEGADVNLEILFNSPGFLRFIWSPRPHIGGNINSAGDTSQAYIGLSWEWTIWRGLFAGFSLGGAWHDGELKTSEVDRKELGCRILFRESIEGGWRFAGRHSISLYLDHISNANLCSHNEGIDNVGIRYGYRL